jgi:aldehyde:ferredoxin oxidoreductase
MLSGAKHLSATRDPSPPLRMTGWLIRMTPVSLCVAQHYSVRKKDDLLPELFYEPLKTGPLAGKGAIDRGEFAAALDAYYRMAGWDTPDGNPSEAKLAELGLGWTAGSSL